MALDPVVWSVSLALELEIRTEDRGGEGRRPDGGVSQVTGGVFDTHESQPH